MKSELKTDQRTVSMIQFSYAPTKSIAFRLMTRG